VNLGGSADESGGGKEFTREMCEKGLSPQRLPDAHERQRAFTREERQHIINYGAYFLIPMGLMLPLAFWYFEMVPAQSRRLVFGGAVAMNLFFMFGLAASVLIAGYAYV